jgi:hypothetical protein
MDSNNSLLTITPPATIPWLSPEEKKQSIVLVDIEADFVKQTNFRLDLNVIFNPLAITRRGITQADFYVGSTGAEITLQFDGYTIKDYTKNMTILAEHANSSTRRRISSLKISPGVKTSSGAVSSEVKLGDISLERDEEKKFEVRFSCAECFLTSACMGSLVKWGLNLPRGEKVFRDFLFGNLYLFGDCDFTSSEICGSVSVRPSDVLFFDNERRVMSKLKSISMLYVLYKRGVSVGNRDGIFLNFAASKS